MLSVTARRWLNWVVAAASVAAVSVVLIPAARQHPAWLHESMSAWPAWQRAVAVLIVTSCVVWLATRLFSPRWGHVRHFPRHPPYWSAAFLGLIAVATYDTWAGLGPARIETGWWHWPVYFLLPLAASLLIRRANREKPPTPEYPVEGHTPEALAQRPELLDDWLRDERESGWDLLDTRPIAVRLARRLAGEPGSVGLVGPFGSGKSTVVGWVRAELEATHPEVLVCQVSCWGFEDASGAVRQILQAAVVKASEAVDCFNVRHLPDDYRQTLTAGGNWVRSLGDLILNTPDPDEQFAALAGSLEAAGVTLVVAVDDLDRTANSKFNPQEVFGLLSRLRVYRRRIKFVMSGSRSFSSELLRLCDHIEPLPTPSVEQVAAIVGVVRERCRTAYPDDITEVDADNDPWNLTQYMLMGVFADYVSPPAAAARLLQTPRSLKHALRQTREAWGRLHGEIDLDHLLFVNVLRFGAPGAFEFLLGQMARFRTDPRSGSAGRDEWAQHQTVVRQEWDRVTQGVEWDRRAALEMIARMLPIVGDYLDRVRQSGGGMAHRPQGIARERYWQRVIRGDLVAPADTDQRVLRAVRAWHHDPTAGGELLRLLETDPTALDVFERFAARHGFGTSDRAAVLRLAEQLLDRTTGPLPRGYSALRTEGWLITLYHLANAAVPQDADAEAWMERRLVAAMRKNIDLVNQLFYWWAAGEPGRGVVTAGGRSRLREVVLREAREQLRAGADLARVVHPTVTFDLFQLANPAGDERGPETPLRGAAHWGWLGPVMLEALRTYPGLLAERIAELLTNERTRDGPDRRLRRGDSALLRAYFGDESDEVVRLLDAERERSAGDVRSHLDDVLSTLRMSAVSDAALSDAK